eukprot:gene82-86_t
MPPGLAHLFADVHAGHGGTSRGSAGGWRAHTRAASAFAATEAESAHGGAGGVKKTEPPKGQPMSRASRDFWEDPQPLIKKVNKDAEQLALHFHESADDLRAARAKRADRWERLALDPDHGLQAKCHKFSRLLRAAEQNRSSCEHAQRMWDSNVKLDEKHRMHLRGCANQDFDDELVEKPCEGPDDKLLLKSRAGTWLEEKVLPNLNAEAAFQPPDGLCAVPETADFNKPAMDPEDLRDLKGFF